ncbi:replication protein A 70 kDa DNA-binding subunit B [Artemisia annua]|uniref:Replication protein A 70 kDa DNA-binding subunit B n=1 Tax=Artemisia annua TaxID=35608 RepID=A0A2U1N183_ARTAN|nr:replication protein A 70 kDa DNA-binding subunit B [Artemisia annua]
MSQIVNGFINDLSAVRDNIKLRVRVLRTWMQPLFAKLNGTRVQVQIRQKLVDRFKHQLEEGNAVMLQHYSLGEIQPKFRVIKKGLRISFLSNTIVEKCLDFSGSIYGFDFRHFNTITNATLEEDGQFDVIGQVVACDDMDCYDKNGKSGKKKPLTLLDAEGNELRCTLWGAFAQQFSDFLTECPDHTKIIVVLYLGMMKIWNGKTGVQNGHNAIKLFLFNGEESITKSEFKDVDDFRQRLLSAQTEEKEEHTASRISTASTYSTKDDFVTNHPGEPSVIVGTICAINEEDGWWYLGCGKCKKKVVKASEVVDLEAETPQKSASGPTEWYCTKCEAVCSSLKSMYRLQIRVHDSTGTCSLSLFNDEVQAYVDSDSSFVPPEITSIIGTKYAFKVFMDKFNATKLLPVFNVKSMSVDPQIIASLQAATTPAKPDNEGTSAGVPVVTPFELESQTDDNSSSTNAEKTPGSNKRSADGSMSSNGKKIAVEIKQEKDE